MQFRYRSARDLAERPRKSSGERLAGASGIIVRPELVLLSGRRCASGERPHAVGEFEHQQPVVLTRAPHGAGLVIEMHLRGTPIGATGTPLGGREVIGTGTWRRRAGGIVVRDLLRPLWIAYVEHADARVEESARERRRIVLVVNAAIVTAVCENRQT